ncbi:hypothetical protein GCM10023084_48400 [Streptomyces lacrimifluminis]|uniref:Uncharacterized protein n=1 Tax=Streptomyces lacrimifluminis TaxID=1500077 RepID=A0A917P163_9ACTN|nr:hypothetical protein [Streptomyces lacrimifluminis]GGJ50450.1 hypothetical protein GCM10012282_54240 [Streptomyces lacrimifluminis]
MTARTRSVPRVLRDRDAGIRVRDRRTRTAEGAAFLCRHDRLPLYVLHGVGSVAVGPVPGPLLRAASGSAGSRRTGWARRVSRSGVSSPYSGSPGK